MIILCGGAYVKQGQIVTGQSIPISNLNEKPTTWIIEGSDRVSKCLNNVERGKRFGQIVN